jgi:pilus assembly protein CpaE
LKIAVVSKDEKHLLEVAKLLRERNPADDVFTVPGALDKLTSMAGLASPDVLVLDQPSIEGGDLERLERLSHLYPRLSFILICQDQTPEFLIKAMRVGVREVLSSPVSAETLLPAMARIAEKKGDAQAKGKVLAFISCKGGSGATFLSTNLGYALATQENKRVALIDLNLQFGDAAMYVTDKKPMATLADVAQQIHRLDASFLASSMLSVNPNFSVLAAPEDPTLANEVMPEHIDAILNLAKRHYDYVILDVGHNLDAVSINALDQADMIFPIMQVSMPYIRYGKRLLGVFRSLDYRKDKIHVIVNQFEKEGEITLQDMKTAYGAGFYKVIPSDTAAVMASVNQGVPILRLNKSSPVAKALLLMAKNLVSDETALAAQGSQESQGSRAARAQGGWLSRVFQRA